MTEVRFNLDGLAKFRKQIGNDYAARVGVLGDSTRTGKGEVLNNAELGVIQMFGSYSRNIPPRDFLLMPMQVKRKDLLKAMQSDMVKKAFDNGEYKKIFSILGQAGKAIVLQAFSTSGFGHWLPNKPSTIARKGSSKPLIDTAQLERSISSDVKSKR